VHVRALLEIGVLIPAALWDGIRDGTVTVAFRRWKRPSVKAGGTLQTGAGLLAIDEVAPITLDEVTDEEARLAGHASAADAIAALRAEGQLYRIRFHRLGDDPRIALRTRDALTADEVADIDRALARLPWAMARLQAISGQPGVVSTVLADAAGMERQRFKTQVRRLKALGLTESLEVGYRLSPRGEAYLRARSASDATTRGGGR
jgi:hypothetical protein